MAENVSKKKKELEELRNAEKKFQALIQKRNELNDKAKVFREERDMLNEKRKELRETMKKGKEERDKLVEEMRKHKELRNTYQQQAKELIKQRRKKKGDMRQNLPLLVEELKADIQMLEYRQETVPMGTHEENELIKKIKDKKLDFIHVKKQLEQQQEIETDLSDTDQAITELFKKADEEHDFVQKFYEESQKKHEAYMKLVQEIAASINESNKQHKKYIEIREEAQNNHEKAMEMRSKVMEIKKERHRRWQESKEILQKQNVKAQKLVADKDKLNEIADQSVDDLKKGKKISLSG